MATLKHSSPKPATQSGSGTSSLPFSLQGMQAYLAGLRTEWGKITWPSKAQVWAQTIVVLVMVSMMTLILFIIDYSLHFLISSIVPHRV
jgi:preprotein translocase subunit SecE